jgi:hypothetical protein
LIGVVPLLLAAQVNITQPPLRRTFDIIDSEVNAWISQIRIAA